MSNNPRAQQRAILTEDGELRELADTPESRLSLIYCIHCGTANRPEARFCYHCGQSFEEQTIDQGGDFAAPLHKAKRSAQTELRPQSVASSLTASMMAMEVLTAMFILGTVITVSVTHSSFVVPFILFAWVAVTWMRYRRR